MFLDAVVTGRNTLPTQTKEMRKQGFLACSDWKTQIFEGNMIDTLDQAGEQAKRVSQCGKVNSSCEQGQVLPPFPYVEEGQPSRKSKPGLIHRVVLLCFVFMATDFEILFGTLCSC